MGKLSMLVVVLAVGFCAGFLFRGSDAPVAASGTPCAEKNGDVNGDATINLADVIYLVKSLFVCGADPVLICTPPPKGLPATGQTKCYDAEDVANVIDCASADFPGQDGFYQAGCPTEGRFVDNGNGTVTDNCTGLMWQKDTADANGDGAIGYGDMLNWQDALKYCENLNFAGQTDWRLPNVRELQSIVDYGHAGPAMDPAFGAELDWYWSSTSYTYNPDYSWTLYFDDGIVTLHPGYVGEPPHFVRAVRGGL